MSSRVTRWSHAVLALVTTGALAGCGESFVSTGAGGGGSTGTSAGGGGSGACQSGAVEDCYDGPADKLGEGVCVAGKKTCEQGLWGPCEGQVLPQSEETCDGTEDDDCDGEIDNGCSCAPGEMKSCYEGPDGTGATGECKDGIKTCTGEEVFGPCADQVLPAAEECNGLDDDCDGSIDEFEDVCDTGIEGPCGAGSYHCVGDQKKCLPANPTTEICDGLDNDCNGAVDESFPEQGNSCSEGACSGVLTCVNETPTCQFFASNLPEVCGDGKDNDCDGVIDPNNQVYALVPFNEATGWGMAGEWAIGPAVASISASAGFAGDPATDHTLDPTNMLAGVVIGGDATTAPHEAHYLTSPAIDISDAEGSVVMSYWRWLNCDAPPNMLCSVDVFDGVSWVPVWANGNGGPGAQIKDSQWTLQALDVTPFKNAAFRVRFGVEVPPGGSPAHVSSWNVDDIRLGSCINGP